VRSHWFLSFLILISALFSHADVIHLKNGRTIWADHVRQNGNHLEYDVGDNSYAIAQSSVDHVEAGGVPPQFASSASARSTQDLPGVVPQEELTAGADLPSKLIRDGHVDKDALRSVEDSSQPEITAAAYFIAGKEEFDSGNFPQARTYFDSALRFQPDSPTIVGYYAAVLMRMGRTKDALSYAQRATRLAPASADAYAMLGAAQYASDDTANAIRSWKTSLRLRPDASIQAYLDKAEREIKQVADFSERASSHFTLHFEGKQTSDAFRQAILMTLESAYKDLQSSLNYTPRDNIAVFLLTQQA
jgi:Tfp pilus assembly protein PilF